MNIFKKLFTATITIFGGLLLLAACSTATQYNLSFNTNGGSSVAAVTFTETSNLSLPSSTKQGYEFGGWFFDNQTFTQPATLDSIRTRNANVVVNAKWNLVNYQINYNLNGGLIDEVNPTVYTVETPTINLGLPIREGFTFAGWFNNANFTGVPETNIARGRTGNINLFAKWDIGTFTVTFASNGGSPVQNLSANFGATISRPADPVRPGFTFLGWFRDQALTQPYQFTTMPSANTIIYAKWELANFPITYVLNNGTNNVNNPVQFSINNNDITLLPPTRSGFTFIGWFDNPNLTGAAINVIPAGSSGARTFYAAWSFSGATGGGGGGGGTTPPPVPDVDPVITIPPTATITYGSALSTGTLSGTANTAGAFTFVNGSLIPNNVGEFTAQVTFTPSGSGFNTISLDAIVTVLPKTVTLSATITKQYDGTNSVVLPTITVVGLVGGDVVTPSLVGGQYASTAIANGIVITYTSVTLGGADAAKYVLDPNPANSPTIYVGNITTVPAVVVTWPTTSAITYGQALSSSTLTGGELQLGSNVFLNPSATYTLVFTDPTIIPENPGAYDPSISTFQFSASVTFTPTDTNYSPVSGFVNVTVNKIAITVTAQNGNKEYDGGVSSSGTPTITLGTLRTGDTLSASQQYEDEDADNGIAIEPTATVLRGAADVKSNYVITLVDGSGNITPKALSITVNNLTKTYGDILTSSGPGYTDFTTSGLVPGETVDSLTLAYDNSVETETKVVGNYANSLVVSAAVGSNNFLITNYTITYNKGAVEVVQKPITITIDSKDKTYGVLLDLSNTATNLNLVDIPTLVTGDDITNIALASTGASATSIVGSYLIDVSGGSPLTGTGLSNYDITFVPGKLTVNRRPLYVYYAGANIIDGSASNIFTLSSADLTNATLNPNYLADGTLLFSSSLFTVKAARLDAGKESGLVNGDTLTSVNVSTRGNKVGADANNSYDVFLNDAQGTGLSNYQIVYNNWICIDIAGVSTCATDFITINDYTGYSVNQVAIVDTVQIEFAPKAAGESYQFNFEIMSAKAFDAQGNLIPGTFSTGARGVGSPIVYYTTTTHPDGAYTFTPKYTNYASYSGSKAFTILDLHYTDLRVTAGSREIDLVFNMNATLKTGELLLVSDLIVIIDRLNGTQETVEVRAIVQPNGTSNLLRIRVDEAEKPQLGERVEVRITNTGKLKIADLAQNLLNDGVLTQSTILTTVPMIGANLSFNTSSFNNADANVFAAIENRYYVTGNPLTTPEPDQTTPLTYRSLYFTKVDLAPSRYKFSLNNVTNVTGTEKNPQLFVFDKDFNLLFKNDSNNLGASTIEINDYIVDAGTYYFLIINQGPRTTGVAPNIVDKRFHIQGTLEISDLSTNVPFHTGFTFNDINNPNFVATPVVPYEPTVATTINYDLSKNFFNRSSYIHGANVFAVNFVAGKRYLIETTATATANSIKQNIDPWILISLENKMLGSRLLQYSSLDVIDNDDKVGTDYNNYINFMPTISGTYYIHIVQDFDSQDKLGFNSLGTLTITPFDEYLTMLEQDATGVGPWTISYNTNRYTIITLDNMWLLESDDEEGEEEDDEPTSTVVEIQNEIYNYYEKLDVIKLTLTAGTTYRFRTINNNPTNIQPDFYISNQNPLAQSSWTFNSNSQVYNETIPWNAWIDYDDVVTNINANESDSFRFRAEYDQVFEFTPFETKDYYLLVVYGGSDFYNSYLEYSFGNIEITTSVQYDNLDGVSTRDIKEVTLGTPIDFDFSRFFRANSSGNTLKFGAEQDGFDLFRVYLSAGVEYTFETDSTGPVDPFIKLYRRNPYFFDQDTEPVSLNIIGAGEGQDSSLGATGNRYDAYFTFTPTLSGLYYIEISGTDDVKAGTGNLLISGSPIEVLIIDSPTGTYTSTFSIQSTYAPMSGSNYAPLLFIGEGSQINNLFIGFKVVSYNDGANIIPVIPFPERDPNDVVYDFDLSLFRVIYGEGLDIIPLVDYENGILIDYAMGEAEAEYTYFGNELDIVFSGWNGLFNSTGYFSREFIKIYGQFTVAQYGELLLYVERFTDNISMDDVNIELTVKWGLTDLELYNEWRATTPPINVPLNQPLIDNNNLRN